MHSVTLENIFSNPNLVSEIQKNAIRKSFLAGNVLLNTNDYVRSVPLVVEGSLKVFREDEEGREILLYYIKPGESCVSSFLGALNHERNKVKAVVDEDAVIYFVSSDDSNRWIGEFPEWAHFIFKLYNKRFEELLDSINAIAFQKMDNRIKHYLDERIKINNSKVIHITHQQLADELGTAREVVSRILKSFEKEGFLKLSRNKITLS
jgi:CRP/FNR family transcriptional regulator